MLRPCALRTAIGTLRWLVMLVVTVTLSTRATAEPTPSPSPFQPFLDAHCVTCHQGKSAKAGLDLENLAASFNPPRQAALWTRIHDQVAKGAMPPKQQTQPEPDERQQFLMPLRAKLHAVSLARQNTEGRVVIRRLNRTEYEQTLRDLLDTRVHIRDILPEDGSAAGFDTVSSALEISPTHLVRYQQAADAPLRAAITAMRWGTSAVGQNRLDPGHISGQFFLRSNERFEALGEPRHGNEKEHERHCQADPGDDQIGPTAMRKLEPVGQKLRTADERHWECREQDHQPESDERSRNGSAGGTSFHVGHGELHLQLGETGDIAPQFCKVTDHPIGHGRIDPHPTTDIAAHRRLIHHPRSTPMPSASPKARAGCSIV